ncbi:hypothetical protein WBG06_25670 [Nocardioides sp. CCNWLW239]|uniref:hypothetical protein n=1 Tax=Nocardioides sp. CCNWLW239 TaxID=3128902 RepID=UPI003017566E
MSENRLQILDDLLNRRIPTAEAHAALKRFPWDEEELIDLRVEHVASVLTDIIDGKLSPDEGTAWADAIDSRDDIGRQPGHEDDLNDALFQLSSPELLPGPLTAEAPRILKALRGETQ